MSFLQHLWQEVLRPTAIILSKNSAGSFNRDQQKNSTITRNLSENSAGLVNGEAQMHSNLIQHFSSIPLDICLGQPTSLGGNHWTSRTWYFGSGQVSGSWTEWLWNWTNWGPTNLRISGTCTEFQVIWDLSIPAGLVALRRIKRYL